MQIVKITPSLRFTKTPRDPTIRGVLLKINIFILSLQDIDLRTIATIFIEERIMLKKIAFTAALLTSGAYIATNEVMAADIPADSAQAIINDLTNNPVSGIALPGNAPDKNGKLHKEKADRGMKLLITGTDTVTGKKPVVFGIVDDKARPFRSTEKADYLAFIALAAREAVAFDFAAVASTLNTLGLKHCRAVQEAYNAARSLPPTVGGCLPIAPTPSKAAVIPTAAAVSKVDTGPGGGGGGTTPKPGVVSAFEAAKKKMAGIPMMMPGAAGDKGGAGGKGSNKTTVAPGGGGGGGAAPKKTAPPPVVNATGIAANKAAFAAKFAALKAPAPADSPPDSSVAAPPSSTAAAGAPAAPTAPGVVPDPPSPPTPPPSPPPADD